MVINSGQLNRKIEKGKKKPLNKRTGIGTQWGDHSKGENEAPM